MWWCWSLGIHSTQQSCIWDEGRRGSYDSGCYYCPGKSFLLVSSGIGAVRMWFCNLPVFLTSLSYIPDCGDGIAASFCFNTVWNQGITTKTVLNTVTVAPISSPETTSITPTSTATHTAIADATTEHDVWPILFLFHWTLFILSVLGGGTSPVLSCNPQLHVLISSSLQRRYQVIPQQQQQPLPQ
jgi:hypothetical protein